MFVTSHVSCTSCKIYAAYYNKRDDSLTGIGGKLATSGNVIYANVIRKHHPLYMSSLAGMKVLLSLRIFSSFLDPSFTTVAPFCVSSIPNHPSLLEPCARRRGVRSGHEVNYVNGLTSKLFIFPYIL